MPYFITDQSAGCSGWAVVKDDGEQMGCHTTKQAAINQMIAVSLAEGIEPGGERIKARKDTHMAIQQRALPANYRPALSADVPEGRACGNCFFYDESRVDTTGTKAWCERWDDFVLGDHYCNSWRMDEATRTLMKGTKMTQAVERRVADFSDIEMRAADEGGPKMTFRGYAAVFNSPSEPLPFTEVIAPGAFKRSLKARNEIKMFVNHNMDRVLASTRAGTLTLAEDERGLVVEAQLPDTTDGRDLSVLLESGDVSSMSFGFTVPKGGDKWNSEGSERTLKQVRLHEVSVVTGFPAYEATTASVRTLDLLATRTNVDAEAIADVLTKLEAGETLPNDEADLLVEVVTKLRDNSSQVEQDFNALDLKRKELDLLFKAV